MPVAILAGTAIYEIPWIEATERQIETPYGEARIFEGKEEHADVLFLPRHGKDHSIPPHRVNYRANIKALEMMGVRYALAAYAVGSINREIPPLSLVALDDLIDFTWGRESTYFEGGSARVHHVDMSEPYCPRLREALLELAPEMELPLRPHGTYVATNGPRLETPAEIRMFAQLGGDVVGMTAFPECVLAKELGICLAGVGFSVNWAAGIEEKIHFVEQGLSPLIDRLLRLFVRTLREVAGEESAESASGKLAPEV